MQKINSNKAVGPDGIPAEVFKYGSKKFLLILAIFFTACLQHCYLPDGVLRIHISPLLKSKLKDPTSSDNYRPIAKATAMSKLVELLILTRIEEYIIVRDNQFGFRTDHSTDMCILVLKDVINYYNCLSTPVFMCFLDIRKAFDRISLISLSHVMYF